MIIWVNGWGPEESFKTFNPHHENTLRQLYCLSQDLLRAKEHLEKNPSYQNARAVQRIDRDRRKLKAQQLPPLRIVE